MSRLTGGSFTWISSAPPYICRTRHLTFCHSQVSKDQELWLTHEAIRGPWPLGTCHITAPELQLARCLYVDATIASESQGIVI